MGERKVLTDEEIDYILKREEKGKEVKSKEVKSKEVNDANEAKWKALLRREKVKVLKRKEESKEVKGMEVNDANEAKWQALLKRKEESKEVKGMEVNDANEAKWQALLKKKERETEWRAEIIKITEGEWRKINALYYEDSDHTAIKVSGISDKRRGVILAQLLLSNHNITSINLDHCTFDEDTTIAIINSIHSNPSISRVELFYCTFGSRDVSIFFGDILRSNTSIVHLALLSCGVTTTGAMSIGRALQSNSSLTHLALTGANNIKGTDAAKIIINSLHSNYSLTSLYFQYIPIGIDEVKDLASVITTSNKCILSSLCFDECSIDDEGATELASAISNNTSILDVDLSNFES